MLLITLILRYAFDGLKINIFYSILQQYQLDCLILFVIGFVLLSMSGVILMEVLAGSLVFGAYGSGVVSSLALGGGVLCFGALCKLTSEQLNIVVERMGSERPIILAKNARGEWDRNPKRGFSIYPFLGEVEFTRDNDSWQAYSSDSFDVFACGCWSGTIELASIAFGNSRLKRNSESYQ